MTVPRPSVSVPSAAQLAPAFRALRLPAPARVTLLAPPWSHATYRVELARGGEVLVRRPLGWTGRDTLQHERAALSLLRAVPEAPVVRAYEIVPPGLLPWPAAIGARLPGTSADRVIGARPERALPIAEALGRAMALVAERTATTTFGTLAEAGRFVPRRGTWEDEVRARVAEGLAAARAASTGLGPLSDAIGKRLRDALPALSTARTFALVHGDPSPGNLLVADDGALSGWIDWEGAVLGDPLLEWAALLAQPAAILAAAVRGYGAERVRALLDDDGRARLEAYALAQVVERTAFAAAPLFDGVRRAAVLARAHDVAIALRSAAARMDAALAATAGGAWTAWRPDPVALVLRRALGRLAAAPPVPVAHAQPLADALSALRLADATAGEVRARWVAQATRLVDALPPAVAAAPFEPIADRAAWRRSLADTAWSGGPRTLALGVLRVGTAAVDRLGDAVDDGVLRGLEALVRALATLEADGDERLPSSLRLAHALRGLAAATALGVHADELRRRVEDAWDVASGGARTADEPIDGVLAAEAAGDPRPGRASVLDAIRALTALPDAPTALLRLALA